MENYKKINKAGHWVNISYVLICFFLVPVKTQVQDNDTNQRNAVRKTTEQNHRPFYTTLFDVTPAALPGLDK